jgi:hypothetical protein
VLHAGAVTESAEITKSVASNLENDIV